MGENIFQKIKLDWSINLGAILQFAGVISVGLALYRYGLQFQFDTEAGLKRGEEARAKYIPIIEAMQKSDETQNFRLEMTSNAIAELRQIIINNSQKLGDIGTDVAVIKSKMEAEEKRNEK